MKIKLFCFGICFQITYLFYSQCNGTEVIYTEDPLCSGAPYYLVFQDDFDSDELDLNKWNPIYGVIRDQNHNTEQQWYTPDNIVLENGVLKLEAREESLINQCFSIWTGSQMEDFCQDFDYTSAEIDSKYKFGYGIFEIRCKIPKGKGFFPAFWTYSGVPDYDEIDIFEFWNYRNIFNQFDLETSVKRLKTNYQHDFLETHFDCPLAYEGVDYSQDFHVIKLKWTPYKIEFYADNELLRREYRFTSLQGQNLNCPSLDIFGHYMMEKAFPLHPMHIISNLAIQANINSPDESTPFPSALEIDYIKYYKQIDACNTDLNITNTEELNLQDDIYNVIVGNNITIGSDVVVAPTDQLTIIVSNEINIDENSILEGNFETIINPAICSSHQLIQETPNVQFKETQYFVKEELNDTLIEVSPNPFTGELLVNIEKDIDFQYTIVLVDLIGNLVNKTDCQSLNSFRLNLIDLKPGAYLLYIFDKKGNIIANQKIFKS